MVVRKGHQLEQQQVNTQILPKQWIDTAIQQYIEVKRKSHASVGVAKHPPKKSRKAAPCAETSARVPYCSLVGMRKSR